SCFGNFPNVTSVGRIRSAHVLRTVSAVPPICEPTLLRNSPTSDGAFDRKRVRQSFENLDNGHVRNALNWFATRDVSVCTDFTRRPESLPAPFSDFFHPLPNRFMSLLFSFRKDRPVDFVDFLTTRSNLLACLPVWPRSFDQDFLSFLPVLRSPRP